MEGRDVGEVVQKLERCAAASLEWARGNAVRFEMSKTEAILFSRKRAHKRCQAPIRVGDQTVRFAPEATRWLGIWLASELKLVENRHHRIAKARQAEARLRRIVSKYGVPPASTRNLQMAIVQGTMLYGAELTWNVRKGVAREYQDAISRMGKATLGAFQLTTLGIVAAESGLTPARALLDHRQASFTRRLFARPQGGEGPEEILERRDSALTTRLQATASLRRHETVEPQQWSTQRRFAGRIAIEKKEEAINTARGHRLANTVWTDGSRLESKRMGAAFAWRSPVGWSGHRYHLGSNKEVFDAEVFAIHRALLWLKGRQGTGRRFTIFADSTAAIERVRTDALGPAQRFAVAAIEVCDRIHTRGDRVTIRWVPSHAEIEGNWIADRFARAAADRSATCQDEATPGELHSV